MIGILYIATGKYVPFFDDFYLSCEEHFIPNSEKHYYIFGEGVFSPQSWSSQRRTNRTGSAVPEMDIAYQEMSSLAILEKRSNPPHHWQVLRVELLFHEALLPSSPHSQTKVDLLKLDFSITKDIESLARF